MAADIVRALRRVDGEDGQALAEYSLVLAFVAMGCIVVLGALGLLVAGYIDDFTAALP